MKEKRPSKYAKSIQLEAATEIAPKVREWIEEDNEGNLIPELAKAIASGSDGYEMARRLEDFGYSPDSELVDILNAVPHHLNRVHQKAVAEWLKSSGLEAPKIGSLVHVQEEQGEIIENDVVHGTSIIFVEGLGHVRRGLGTHGIYIDWENLKFATNP